MKRTILSLFLFSSIWCTGQSWKPVSPSSDIHSNHYLAPTRNFIFDDGGAYDGYIARIFNGHVEYENWMNTEGFEWYVNNVFHDSVYYVKDSVVYMVDVLRKRATNQGSLVSLRNNLGANYIGLPRLLAGDWGSPKKVVACPKVMGSNYARDFYLLDQFDTTLILSNVYTRINNESYTLSLFIIEGDIYLAYEEGVVMDGDLPPRISRWNGSGWDQVGLNTPDFNWPKGMFFLNNELYMTSGKGEDALGNPSSLLKLTGGLYWTSANPPDLTGGITDYQVYGEDVFLLEDDDITLFNYRGRLWQYRPGVGFRIVAGGNNEFIWPNSFLSDMFVFQDEVYFQGNLNVKTAQGDTLYYNAKFPIEKWNEENVAPVAMSDYAVWSTKDDSVKVDVLANDNAMDGDFLKYTIVQEPKGGEYQILYDGTLVYYPFNDTWYDTIRYEVCDQLGACDQSVIYFTRDRRDIGLDDQSLLKINVFPNPSSERLTITGVSPAILCMLGLKNSLGQTLLEKEVHHGIFSFDVDVSGYPNGLYYLTMENDEGVRIESKINIIH